MIAILLVLYNDSNHLPRLIQSLTSQSIQEFEIHALETSFGNVSSDTLRLLYPEAIIYDYKGNLGYAGGNNFLASQAVLHSPDYLFILNTDMELSDNCLQVLIENFEADKSLGGIAPVVLFGSKEERTKTIQHYVSNYDFRSGKIKLDYSNSDYMNEFIPICAKVNTLNGGAMMILATLYHQVGLFNEDNFMYGDERDFAWKVDKTDYQFLVTKASQVWHHHDWSKQNAKRYNLEYYYINRNHIFYLIDKQMWQNLLFMILKELSLLPIKVKWALKRASINLIWYYYLGILHGLLRKRGKSSIAFD